MVQWVVKRQPLPYSNSAFASRGSEGLSGGLEVGSQAPELM